MPGYGKQIAIGFLVLAGMVLVASVVEALTPTPEIAAVVYSAILISPILLGFLLPVQRFIGMAVPPFRGAGGAIVPNLQAQPFPQICIFQVEISNQWILAFPALLAIGSAALVFIRPGNEGQAAAEGATSWVGSMWMAIMIVFWGAAMICTIWMQERLLLRRCEVRLGMLAMKQGEELSYWFFGDEGVRMGGMATRMGGIALASPFIPVFCKPGKPEKHRAGFAFLFHRFAVVDSRHLSQQFIEQLMEAQRSSKTT
jgi:hypothetical protein